MLAPNTGQSLEGSEGFLKQSGTVRKANTDKLSAISSQMSGGGALDRSDRKWRFRDIVARARSGCWSTQAGAVHGRVRWRGVAASISVGFASFLAIGRQDRASRDAANPAQPANNRGSERRRRITKIGTTIRFRFAVLRGFNYLGALCAETCGTANPTNPSIAPPTEPATVPPS